MAVDGILLPMSPGDERKQPLLAPDARTSSTRGCCKKTRRCCCCTVGLVLTLFVLGWMLAPQEPEYGLVEIHMNMTQIVRDHGYPIETHEIPTEDGYILTAFRIPHGLSKGNSSADRPVVFMQHALLCSSFDWVNQAPTQSLGYILADAGFDVWMGNNRGNTYSKKHKSLSVDSDEYWDFTYDDHALKDVPAFIDYALHVTGRASLSWVGHSQGTLQAFAGFSHNAKVAEKVDLFVALAPVAYVHHSTSPIFGALTSLHVANIVDWFGMKEFLADTPDGRGMLNEISILACGPLDKVCNAAIIEFCGPSDQINMTRLPLYLAHTPAGTSTKNMDHWSQGIRNDVFQMYDYGSASENKVKYGVPAPPKWNLNKLTVKTALFTGSSDVLADPTDVKRLMNEMPSASLVYHREFAGFAHLDFTWGLRAATEVYPDVVEQLKKHSRPGVSSRLMV